VERDVVLISLRVHDGEASCDRMGDFPAKDVNHQLTITRDEHGDIWYTVVSGYDGITASFTNPKLHTSPWMRGTFYDMIRWYNDQQILAMESPYDIAEGYFEFIPRRE